MAKRLKVLFVIDSLRQGGAERSTLELIKALAPLGVDSHLFTFDPEGPLLADAQTMGIEVITATGPFARQRAPLKLVQQIRTWRPSIVHTSLFKASTFGRLSGFATDTPVITSLTGLSFTELEAEGLRLRARLARAVLRNMDVWTSNHLTDHFHAVSPAVRDYHMLRYGLASTAVTVVPRGRDGALFAPPSRSERASARSDLRISESTLVVAHLGRHVPVKNLELLIRLIGDQRGGGCDIVLIQGGSNGPTTENLLSLQADLRINDGIKWLGHIPDVVPVLRAADLLALPSLSEGLNGAIIEAMATGLPVLASDIPSNRFLVEDGVTGLLAPPYALDEWTMRLEHLKEPSVRRQMGRAGRAAFDRSFTLDASARGLLHLYQTVLGR